MMRSGMDALFGSRVTPVIILSVDDVRGYLGSQLKRINNKRLKIGNTIAVMTLSPLTPSRSTICLYND